MKLYSRHRKKRYAEQYKNVFWTIVAMGRNTYRQNKEVTNENLLFWVVNFKVVKQDGYAVGERFSGVSMLYISKYILDNILFM